MANPLENLSLDLLFGIPFFLHIISPLVHFRFANVGISPRKKWHDTTMQTAKQVSPKI